MTEEVNLTFKTCFLGDSGVGKTSLIRRFVFNEFDDSYLRTMGTKVSKKTVTIDMPDEDKRFNITFMVWDIMGDIHFRGLLHHSYIFGAKGAFLVYDVTRSDTLEGLTDWVDSLIRESEANIPILFIANKVDLTNGQKIDNASTEKLAQTYNTPWLLTSAKTGENVEKAFEILGKKMIADYLKENKSSANQ